MYIIQINGDGKVVDIMKARADATAEAMKVVGDIPTYEPKRGYRGELMYNSEQGLYWADVEVPAVIPGEVT